MRYANTSDYMADEKEQSNGQFLEDGFSLLELLVVMAIMALLVGVVAPKVMGYLANAKVQATKVQLQNIVSALELYRLDVGEYPSGENLDAIVTRPSNGATWNGPYLPKASALQDAWGQAFKYKMPGDHGEFDVLSYGADRKEGGEADAADIANWE